MRDEYRTRAEQHRLAQLPRAWMPFSSACAEFSHRPETDQFEFHSDFAYSKFILFIKSIKRGSSRRLFHLGSTFRKTILGSRSANPRSSHASAS